MDLIVFENWQGKHFIFRSTPICLCIFICVNTLAAKQNECDSFLWNGNWYLSDNYGGGYFRPSVLQRATENLENVPLPEVSSPLCMLFFATVSRWGPCNRTGLLTPLPRSLQSDPYHKEDVKAKDEQQRSQCPWSVSQHSNILHSIRYTVEHALPCAQNPTQTKKITERQQPSSTAHQLIYLESEGQINEDNLLTDPPEVTPVKHMIHLPFK